MDKMIFLTGVMQFSLFVITVCGGVTEQDQAVCQTRQQLIAVKPADSAEVQAVESADEFLKPVAGEALIKACQATDGPDLCDAYQKYLSTLLKFSPAKSNY